MEVRSKIALSYPHPHGHGTVNQSRWQTLPRRRSGRRRRKPMDCRTIPTLKLLAVAVAGKPLRQKHSTLMPKKALRCVAKMEHGPCAAANERVALRSLYDFRLQVRANVAE